jgi:hypothetical protein
MKQEKESAEQAQNIGALAALSGERERAKGVQSLQLSPELERELRIFHPSMLRRNQHAATHGTRFVHYTSADAAMDILRKGEVWMRQSSCMNDYLEVLYGMKLLEDTYNSTPAGHTFQVVLNRIFAGITQDIAQRFNNWRVHLLLNTYFTCVSEHLDVEDAFGRLSMWRAYGSTTGVALVLNNSVFLTPADGLKAYSSPVAYLNRQGFESEFGQIVEGARKEEDFIRQLGREKITGRVFNMLMFAALCTKHPGFAEEKEWRVVYCPSMEESRHITRELVTFKGLPQMIHKIPLKDISEAGYFGAVPRLIDRIIIGPTQYPRTLLEVFVELLGEAGVKDPQTKVCLSDIPLRR